MGKYIDYTAKLKSEIGDPYENGSSIRSMLDSLIDLLREFISSLLQPADKGCSSNTA